MFGECRHCPNYHLAEPPSLKKSVQTPIHRKYLKGARNDRLGSTIPHGLAKNTQTVCAISPKGKAMKFQLCMLSGLTFR